ALISDKLARKHRVLPLREEEGSVVLAMSNPMDLLALEDVGRAVGKPVKPVVARHSAVMNAINRFYWEPE
ncbi:MAG TPA: type II secretion system protein GspE, partial [Candidatus Hydrogenedentes bacterium]|nr:type II secretion system protein GspE [Candidatus Hydrogenedentota bacterium]